MNLTASTSARNLILFYLLFGAGWALIIPASFGIALASLPQEMGGVFWNNKVNKILKGTGNFTFSTLAHVFAIMGTTPTLHAPQ